MKIVTIEFFNSLSESKTFPNKCGKNNIQKMFPNRSSLWKLDHTELDYTQQIILSQRTYTIFKCENSVFNDKVGMKATNICLTPSSNIYVGSTIIETTKYITITGGTSLNK